MTEASRLVFIGRHIVSLAWRGEPAMRRAAFFRVFGYAFHPSSRN